jgi:8-oxo-dGTP pyrophosphatase MutT (NUDIX family)
MIKNTFIGIIKNNKLLLILENNNKLNLPGGKIDSGETSRKAMYREFKEEVGPLPNIYNIKSYIYNDHTKIYIANTDDKIIYDPKQDYIETKGFFLVDLDELKINLETNDYIFINNKKYQFRNLKSIKKFLFKLNYF